MYHPTTRVLATLELLQTNGRMSGSELAARLGVNGRTLRRYIARLEDLGIPIAVEHGRHGGYMLVAGYKLPPMMFTDEEALALSVGLLAARGLGLAATDPGRGGRAGQARARDARRTCGGACAPRTRRWRSTFRGRPASADGAALAALSAAAQASRRVRLRYRSAQSAPTEREFDPYGLAYRSGRWYVVGHCHLRQGLRSFRIDRILGVHSTEAGFERPADFDALGHLVFSVATIPRAFAVEVLLKTDLATARRELFATIGVLEAAAGRRGAARPDRRPRLVRARAGAPALRLRDPASGRAARGAARARAHPPRPRLDLAPRGQSPALRTSPRPSSSMARPAAGARDASSTRRSMPTTRKAQIARQTSKSARVDAAQISPTERGWASVSTIARRSGSRLIWREGPLVIGRPRVTRVLAPDRAVDAAPGVDAPDPFRDEVGRAQVELDGFGRGRPLLQPVVPFRPQEQAVDDLAGLVDHARDEVLGRERALLHEDRAQPLARSHRVRRLDELLEAEAASAHEQLAQPVVGARGRREHHPPVLDRHRLADAGAGQRELPAPALLVEGLHEAGKIALRQAPFALHGLDSSVIVFRRSVRIISRTARV